MADAAPIKKGVSCNAPDAGEGQQDFIKGWTHPELLENDFLKESLRKVLRQPFPIWPPH